MQRGRNQERSRRRAAMLAGTAFTGAFIAAIAGNPDSALAACVVTSNPNTVTCNDTVTDYLDNIDAATSPSSSKHQRFTTGGDVNVTINAGQTVSGQGLVVINQQAGTNTTVTNNGALITDDPVLGGMSGPLFIYGAGGTIDYLGNGSSQTTFADHGAIGIEHNRSGTINIGTSSAPISGLFSADSGISAAIRGGEINVHLHGGSLSASGSIYAFGLHLANQLAAGNINATLTGNTAINTTTAGGFFDAAGIHAQNTSTGNVTVTSDANIGLTGTAFRFGIHANASAGNVGVTQTGGTILAQSVGIYAEASGNITVTQSGGQIGSASAPVYGGIQATSTAGTIDVTAKDIFATYNAVYALVNGGSANLSVTANGALSANAATIRTRNDGTGSTTVTTASGSAITGAGGIEAQSYGGGAINITNAGTMTTSIAHGIYARSAGNIAVTSTGAITANWLGIDAEASGSGNVTVNVANDVTSGAGAGVLAIADAGNVAVNVTGGTIRGTSWYGVQAGSTTGNAVVTIGPGVTAHGVDIDGAAMTIDNAGVIVGDVQFHGGNGLFVMNGPGASLSGIMLGGSGTVRFAGSGSNSFDLSKLNTNWTLIDKTGPSNWSLTGTSNYTGAVTINGGTLSVNTDLTSASGITVNSGALGGSGTVGNVTIGAGGSLAPGNSIGVLNIAGNLNFVGAGNYVVEVDGAASDRTIVGGTATIDGKVVVTPLSRVITKTTYNIFTAGTLSGTFGAAAMSNNFGRNPMLSYDGLGNIFLTVDVGLLSPILTGAVTQNQSSVASAIDAHLLGGTNVPAAFDALFTLSSGGLKNALDQLSGEVHASTTSLLADESGYARNAILSRLRQASYGGTMGAMASLTVGGPQAFADGDEMSSALAYAKSPIVRKAPMLAPKSQSDVVFWAQGFGAWGKFDGDGNAASARRDLAGFFTGIDTRAGEAGRIGIAAGYTGSKNNTEGRGSSNVDTAHAALYGGWSLSALNLRAGGAFAAHRINTDRTINIPGFFDRAFASYEGHTGQVFGELGYGFALNNIAVEPFAGAAWARVRTDGATERGGAAALNITATTFETGYSTLGVRAASMIAVGDNMILIPRASLAWQHAFGGTTPSATLAFAAMPPSPFTVSGVPIARDALLAEAALDLAIGRHATLGVAYTGQIARNVADHGAKGRFSYRF